MKNSVTIIILILLFPFFNTIQAQSLFESAGLDESISEKLEINGFVKGFGYFGESLIEDDLVSRSLYGETALKLKAQKPNWGKAYADIRFRTGFEYSEKINQFLIREAYVSLNKKKFGIKLGKQIEVWGRADGINPTNNITPQNYFFLSADQDDNYLGNYMAKLELKPIPEIQFKAIWIPKYQESIYRFDLFDMPEYISFIDGDYPNENLKNSSYAFKLDFLLNKIDGSVSYFNGHDPMPALYFANLPTDLSGGFYVDMLQKSYHQQTWGADFSTTLGAIGFRGEAAYKITRENHNELSYVPNPEINWVVGFDYSSNKFNLILQYIGKYVVDYIELTEPMEIDLTMMDPTMYPMIPNLIDQQIAFYNGVIFNQKDEFSHSVSSLIKIDNEYKTFAIDLFGLYNFTTEEYLIRPQISYKLTDAFKLAIGGQYYYGKEFTQFDWISPVFNGVFIESKISF